MKKIQQWLKEHAKEDLMECSWAEIKEAMAFAGYSCPMADHALEEAIKEGRFLCQ